MAGSLSAYRLPLRSPPIGVPLRVVPSSQPRCNHPTRSIIQCADARSGPVSEAIFHK